MSSKAKSPLSAREALSAAANAVQVHLKKNKVNGGQAKAKLWDKGCQLVKELLVS